jgi:phenylacetate-CoA ligase
MVVSLTQSSENKDESKWCSSVPEANDFWQPEEGMPREDLKALQLQRLRDCVARIQNVPFYKDTFRREHITPDSIRSLDDLRRLPFTNKEDLRQHYPLGFMALPKDQVVRIHGSSGTTGLPTYVAYTKNDLNLWANLCARFLYAGGVRPQHTAHVAFGYGMFTGGFGLHYGIECLGAAVVPASAGNTRRHIEIMHALQPEVLICTPSYALVIAEVAQELGNGEVNLPLKIGHFGGEPWTEDMREQIEQQLHIRAFNNYGLSEVMGPGVSGECWHQNGMHIQEDHFLVECIDPDTLEPVAPGEKGELVFTSMTREAMPLLRYRTRDIATLDESPCACGRTSRRMSRITGRTDDMLIIRGVNIFPSQIEEALLRVEGTAPHYQIEVDRPGILDELTVRVEIRPQDFSDKMRHMQQLKERIDKEIQSVTGLRANVELVKPQTLERFVGKAKRVIDKRNLKG